MDKDVPVAATNVSATVLYGAGRMHVTMTDAFALELDDYTLGDELGRRHH